MRVCIIDDFLFFWLAVELRAAGHEVLFLLVDDPVPPEFVKYETKKEWLKRVQTLPEIVVEVAAFQPDVILLDHDFNQAFKGRDVFNALPNEKYISSSSEDWGYISRSWGFKRCAETQYERAVQLFLEEAEAVVGQ